MLIVAPAGAPRLAHAPQVAPEVELDHIMTPEMEANMYWSVVPTQATVGVVSQAVVWSYSYQLLLLEASTHELAAMSLRSTLGPGGAAGHIRGGVCTWVSVEVRVQGGGG